MIDSTKIFYPAYERGDINNSSGESASATSWFRTVNYLDSIIAITTAKEYVVKIFNYSSESVSSFVGSEQITVDGYLDISDKITSNFVRFAIRYPDRRNIAIANEQTTVGFYQGANFIELDGIEVDGHKTKFKAESIISDLDAIVDIDSSLTKEGSCADAAATGRVIDDLNAKVSILADQNASNLIKTYPAFESGDIANATGIPASATSYMRTYGFLDSKNISAISTTGEYVVKVFNYSSKSHDSFIEYKQITVNGHVALSDLVTGRYIKLAIRHSNYSNINLASEAGKISFYETNMWRSEDLTNCNWVSSSGTFASSTYKYRQSWRYYFNIDDFGGIVSKYGFQYLIGLYDETFTYIGNIAYKDGENFTYELLSAYCAGKNLNAKYFTILINSRDTAYTLTSNDYIYSWYMYSPNEDASKIIDKLLFANAYRYGGQRIVIEMENPISYVTNWLNTSFGSAQDADCYGDIVVRLNSLGTVRTYNAAIKERISEVVMTGDVPHANSVCFGDEKYNENDDFPLLYANAYNNEVFPRGTLFAYRYRLNSENISSMTLVQTIRIGFTENSLWTTGSDARPYGNFAVDHDRHRLIAYTTLDGDVNKTRFFEFPMPALADGADVTLNIDNIITWYDVDKQPYPQGCCYYNGKMYCASGFGDPDPKGYPGYLYVVDLLLKRTVTVLNFNDIGITSEPECLYVYKGRLAGGYGQSYLFNL